MLGRARGLRIAAAATIGLCIGCAIWGALVIHSPLWRNLVVFVNGFSTAVAIFATYTAHQTARLLDQTRDEQMQKRARYERVERA